MSKKNKAYNELKRSLLSSLEARGLTEKVYADKVDEYMDFWQLLRELRADIADRGLTVVDDRGRISENRSVSLSIQVSRQMLVIFNALGFKQNDANGGDPDDDL